MVQLNLIVAACENSGIAKSGILPWKLPSEEEYYHRIITETRDKNKKNVILMGRKSWDCLQEKPMPDRINFVLSRTGLDLSQYKDKDVYLFNSLEEAIKKLKEPAFQKRYETIWVVGGSHMYKIAMDSSYFYRFYFTRIFQPYNCDTFCPPMPGNVKKVESEMDYFSRMTTVTKNPNKKNVCIMGRRTWDCIPPKYKPLPNRINMVLSRSDLDVNQYKDVYVFKSLDQAIEKLEDNKFRECYETAWVIGGSYIYKESMDHKNFYRCYLTRILKDFDCDTFFPPLPETVKEVTDPHVPTNVQTEKGIEFVYKIYENTNFQE